MTERQKNIAPKGTIKKSTVKEQEIKHFQKDSAHWWDESGAFAPLHKLNPTRIEFIKGQILEHFKTDSLKNLDILDIGCGGGLVCEPLARLGANVSGIDADEQAIQVAQDHARQQGLKIDYTCTNSETICQENKKYDVVCALEIIEHVDTPDVFLKTCLECLKPNGLIIISTLNRTPQSFLLGIVAAEHILGWVPKGTHHWKQFVKPHEIRRLLAKENFSIKTINGLNYSILKKEFNLSTEDISNNYILSASTT
ncbi:MAG: bifunctional 2-polyprenyl-6-hydroxyphenol methylase/3-demethylubiquinol 3-O-methyltransferase UbiG [Bdellovibrionales bacterium]